MKNLSLIVSFVQDKFLVEVECPEFRNLERKVSTEYLKDLKRVELEAVLRILSDNPTMTFPWQLKEEKKMESLFVS